MNGTAPVGSQIPFGDLPKEQMEQILSQCQSQACKAATTALQVVRNDVLLGCDEVKRATASRNEYATPMGVFFTLAIAVFAAAGAASATIVGIPVGAILAGLGFVFLAVALVFALLLYIQQSVLDDAVARLRATKTKFIAAAGAVESSCNEYCRPNLDLPACPP